MSTRLRRLTVEQWRAMAAGRGGFVAPELDAASAERLRAVFGAPIGAEEAVRRIVDDVRRRADAAVREWTQRIDGVETAVTRVPASELEHAQRALPPDVLRALEVAAERIRAFHERQLDGVEARGASSAFLRAEPIRRAGCYAPGGRAAYPSTVLMTVIPAQVAGVESVCIASPPGAGGSPHPLVLAAAHLLGVAEVHAMGGAQAVAALAFGTESVERVDVIAGPGNLFVTLAKRAVYGAVGIDQLAGPSEILVIASGDADAALIAADLVSQLEHDPLAWAVCITDDSRLAAAVEEEFASRAGEASRAGVIATAAAHAAVVTVPSLADALTLCAEFSPEHVSLQGAGAEQVRDRVRRAGAVFCGASSPVSIGDYIAGPNHTLPTQGSARYGSPLGVADFMRTPSVVQLSQEEFAALAPAAVVLAEAEGLPGHAAALRARLASRSGAS